MDDRVRVLSVLNRLGLGGHENRLLTLAQQIDQQRFNHRIVTLTVDREQSLREQRAAGLLRPEFAASGITVDDLGLLPAADVGRRGLKSILESSNDLMSAVRRLVRYIRRHQIDVIDAHHTVAMLAAVLAARITRTPIILSSYHVEPWKRPLMGRVGQFTLGSADALITDSEFRSAEIRNWLNDKSVPIEVVRTGLDVPQPTQAASDVRRELGLPLDPQLKIVGQVGGLVEFKGHRHLIEAATTILHREPDTIFFCCGFSRGTSDYEDSLRNRIAALGLEDRFFIRGWPGAIGDVWQLFDVFVHPSTFDSIPLVVIEALALGKPIVSTNVGGIPEVVEPGNSGLLVEPGQPEPIADAILKLLQDDSLAQRLGVEARKQYESSWTTRSMTETFESLYARLARHRVTDGDQRQRSRAA